MARPKNYQREDAIQKACNAFWENGFQTLGIRAIEDRVGLGRFAIRTEFNGKEGLFLEVLEMYRQNGLKYVIEPIRAAEDISVLKNLLTNMTIPTKGSCAKYGCLFVNTMVENATLQNPEFKKYTSAHFNDIRESTANLIDRAKSAGNVKMEVDSENAGEFIKGALIAIGLISRDAHDVSAAKGYVKMANTTIESWRKNKPRRKPRTHT